VPPDPDRVLSDFIDAWNAGRRPDVDEHLARVEPDRRDELATDIAAFVAFAPTPDYDDAAIAAIRAEPAVASAAASARSGGGLWPALLPRLRERAALSTAQLATALVGALGLPADREPKARGYLERLEAGDLEPRGLSGRLLDALARLLGVPRDDLEAAGAFGAPAPAPALFRAEGPAAEALRDDLDVIADALAAPGAGDWDEVDDLFRGGAA
jgi:transcriptional regulator with XRE-family HTH domain